MKVNTPLGIGIIVGYIGDDIIVQFSNWDKNDPPELFMIPAEDVELLEE